MKYYVDEHGKYLGGWDENPPTGSIEVPSPPERIEYLWVGGEWVAPPLSEEVIYETLVVQEQALVVSELEYSDIQLNIHSDNDPRAIATVEEWQGYRRALRDYVKGGVVVGDRPQKPV